MTLYYTESNGPDGDAFRRGLRMLLQLANGAEAAILIRAKDDLNNNLFEDVLGRVVVGSLSKKKPAVLGNVVLRLLTERTVGDGGFRGAVIVPFGNPKLVKQCMGSSRFVDVVYVAWRREELEGLLVAYPNAVRI